MSKRKEAIDPAVAGLLDEAKRREEVRRKSPKARKKARRDAERSRATYDIPDEIQAVIGEIAEMEGMSKSATVALILAVGAHEYMEGTLEFTGAKQVIRHPLYEWVVDDDTLTEILKGDRNLLKQ